MSIPFKLMIYTSNSFQTEQGGFDQSREYKAFLAIAELISNSIPANFLPETASNAMIDNYETYFNYLSDLI